MPYFWSIFNIYPTHGFYRLTKTLPIIEALCRTTTLLEVLCKTFIFWKLNMYVLRIQGFRYLVFYPPEKSLKLTICLPKCVDPKDPELKPSALFAKWSKKWAIIARGQSSCKIFEEGFLKNFASGASDLQWHPHEGHLLDVLLVAWPGKCNMNTMLLL